MTDTRELPPLPAPHWPPRIHWPAFWRGFIDGLGLGIGRLLRRRAARKEGQ